MDTVFHRFDYIARDSQAIDNKSNLSLTRYVVYCWPCEYTLICI